MAEPVEGRERVVERFCAEEDGERVDLAFDAAAGLEAPCEPALGGPKAAARDRQLTRRADDSSSSRRACLLLSAASRASAPASCVSSA